VYSCTLVQCCFIENISLFLGYVLVIAWTNAEQYIYQFSSLALLIQIGFISSIVLPLAAVGCVLLWSQDGWAHHPLMLKLKNLYPSNEPSRSSVAVANAINVEMRRPDLFSSGHYSQKVESFFILFIICFHKSALLLFSLCPHFFIIK